MNSRIIFVAIVGIIFLAIPNASFGLGTSDDAMSNNQITDGSNDHQDLKDSRKYDPSIFDILGSDYFDDSSEKAKYKVVSQQEVIKSDAPEAPKDVPVGPIVEEEEVTTSRPFCVGCPIEADPENGKVQSMAVFAFTAHRNGLDALDQAVRMVRVVNAMTQVVAGQKYILDLEVGVTNCTKNEEDEDPNRCTFDPNQTTYICNFEVIEQAWINNKEVVRSKCSREDVESDADASPVDDEDDAEYQKEEIEPAIELGSDEIDQTTMSPDDEIIDRRKRDTPGSGKLGGHRDADESKEMLMDLATFAVQQLDAIDPDDDARLVMEVVNAKKQTVSGWLYDLDIRVAYTTCPENQPVSLEKCKDKIVTPYRICSVKILFQPWQTVQKKVTESQCYPEKYKKGKKIAKELSFKKANEVLDDKHPMLGGYQTVDVTSQELTELANFVVDFVDKQSNAIHAQKMIKIWEAQRQVVSGIKTKVVIELGYTSCRKHHGLDKSQCEIDEQREHQVCNVTVWEQPWLKSKKITESKCGARSSMMTAFRKKRSLSLFSVSDLFQPDHEEFGKFVSKFNKQYESTEEYQYRFGVFQENMKKVKLLQENEQGTATYGATQFADLTEEEFSRFYLGLRPDLRQGRLKVKKAKIPVLNSVPDEFDWRNYSAVTPIKNQGMCGSCWAFSVTGNIEGLYANKYKKLVSFSEQELVDCDTLDEGCNGGLPENAYKSIQKLGGLETESAYPYDGRDDKCSFDTTKAAAKVTGFVEIPKNETEMAMWLVKNGPISIGLNANAMQFYFGGVSHPWKFLCSKKSLDHGVLIVGYGVHTTSIRHKTMPYWIIKNSWGRSWGEQGYYRVYRGDNTCGVAEMATSAVVE